MCFLLHTTTETLLCMPFVPIVTLCIVKNELSAKVTDLKWKTENKYSLEILQSIMHLRLRSEPIKFMTI